MPPLYIVQQGAKLRVRNRRLVVEESGKQLASLPLGQVSQVVLFGNIGLTTPAITALLARSIDVVFLSLSGQYRGRLAGGVTPHVPLRRKQYQLIGEDDFSLAMAKGFVTAKLRHQRALLQRHNRELGDVIVTSAIQRLQSGLEEVPRKQKISSLRGVEGAAAAAYFSGFRCLFAEEWHFDRRLRRPPPDPVNAMLSFGYTIMANLAESAVRTVGLDPYAGFLHDLAYNRPALGLDLMEEFRPVVDGIVLWCCRGGLVTPDDFEIFPVGDGENEKVLLNDRGKRAFLAAFEKRLSQRFTHPIRRERLLMRQCLVEQARQVRRHIEEDQPGFQGMGFR